MRNITNGFVTIVNMSKVKPFTLKTCLHAVYIYF